MWKQGITRPTDVPARRRRRPWNQQGTLIVALCVGWIVAAPAVLQAQNAGSIGLYADPGGLSPNISATPYVSTSFFVVVHPDTMMTAGGIVGAEYRIAGTTPNAIWTAAYDPCTCGPWDSPFSDESKPVGQRGGVNAAFPTCRVPDASGAVVFSTIHVVLFEDILNLELQVLAKDPPSNPLFDCPLIYACDEPVFTAHCVDTVSGKINASVAVDRSTFGQVKRLYR